MVLNNFFNSSKSDIFKDLTESKRKILKYDKGPILIIAGAGIGKTTVLTRKVGYLINKGVNPSEIFMSTFTVKASEDMKYKIRSLVENKDLSNMYIGTLDSFFSEIYKEFSTEDQYVDFEILDDFGRYLFIKKNLDKLGLKDVFLDLPLGVRYSQKKTNIQSSETKNFGFSNKLISDIINLYTLFSENLIDVENLKNYYNKDIDYIKEDILYSITGESREKGDFDLETVQKYILKIIKNYC